MPKKQELKPSPRTVLTLCRGKHPPSLQVGAICFRRAGKGVRIMLITSRDTGRWVIPKGWPTRKHSEAWAAAREAYEEAGILGTVSEKSIGFYTYRKGVKGGLSMPCVVRVYPLEARERLRHYPETGQRRVKWFKRGKAARKVRDPELARILREFDPDRRGKPPRMPKFIVHGSVA
ncbi:NUDIX hydrolase [Amaricoccus solimangrovi]|uniref:NUDIX hydrolase n=1 Tax=Amaricoccus solimangrovi TaxID=2589815 RepID=A0A501WWM1_9RHOB|nr:NUDIX hydrolase [Amaricoccus solimangrovi]TPE53669.1 NUDIX hydrolase [Amaricoccus solimangrovi]